ncbi:MAG: N-acetylmuramoyl-L-alanine amidase [Deltaproteobacteria bacterium]|nr:N-acetylmuramoyl-L-alanine amidase [Deltaproteobacteria bacterium]
MRPEYIIIHHSLTKDGATVSWGAIRRYHTQTLGWRDIGYHFGIELVGEHYEILMGRLPNEVGAHCKERGMNRMSLGVCCVGNFDLRRPPDAQWEACLRLTRFLMDSYNIAADHVLGHRELATYKSCPGRLWDMSRFRSLLGGQEKVLPEGLLRR